MPKIYPGFPAQGMRFLRELAKNNNREWFIAHKGDYEKFVKEPMIELVLALGGAIQGFAPEMETDPKRAIYRIYRDIRFSADKSPYKTHVSALFSPRGLKKHASASLYLQLDPKEMLVAGGVYMPGSKELLAIRRHIAAKHDELRAILADKRCRRLFGGLEGESLVRIPKGFSAEHPAADPLRMKQLYVYATEPSKLALGPKLVPRVLELFGAMMPLVRFLNAPLRRKR